MKARDCFQIDGKSIEGECHVQPQNLLVARRRWYRRAPIGFRPAGVPKGRALCKRRGRPHALRRRCRGRGADQERDGHAACRACNMPGRMHRDAIYMSRPAAALPVTARPGPSITSPRFASIRRAARSRRTATPIRLPTRPIHMTHGHSVGEHPGRVQQSERAARLPHQQGLHAGRRGEAAGPDRRRHLRPPGARDARQPAGDPGHPRQRRHAHQGGRPGRAESLRLQGRRADERSVDRAQRRQGIRPAAPRFPSDQAVDVRVDRDAEQDVHVSRWRAAGSTRRSHTARRRWPSRTTSGRVRRPARFTSIRTAVSCTGRIAPRRRSSFRARRCSKAARTASSCTRSTRSTGEPTPIQHIETRAIHPRTFHIDPSGRLLVAQHNLPVNVRDGDAVKTIPAGLSVFRIGDDGKLTFVRKYDIDVGDKTMFWMGMVPL